MSRLPSTPWTTVCVAVSALVFIPRVAAADDGTAVGQFAVNNLWLMLCAALVFIMHLGFAALEAGMTRAKNTTNILFKNTFVVAIGILTYALCGFNLMYPAEFNGYLGFGGFGLSEGYQTVSTTADYADGGYTYWTEFLFQGMFAATAATIVSGAVAERMKLSSFMIFSTVFVALVYPIAGSWKWGGGFLEQQGFYDFAGSTLVHSVGGWGALAGALLLGPRLGKYAGRRINAIPGSKLPLATIGVFLLWFGWFGFNGGSVLSADPALTSYALVTTCLAAAAGVVAAIAASWISLGKPDLSMALNGALAGLVGITAGADTVGVNSAVVIGAVAGGLVVAAVMAFDRLRIDDPVGAISVHLVCGMWGTLAVGIFSRNPDHTLVKQLVGIASYAVFSFSSALLVFGFLKATLGIRVSPREEIEGLDYHEHGMHAYDVSSTPPELGGLAARSEHAVPPSLVLQET